MMRFFVNDGFGHESVSDQVRILLNDLPSAEDYGIFFYEETTDLYYTVTDTYSVRTFAGLHA